MGRYLVQHFNIIPYPHQAFDQNRAVDPSLTFVVLGDLPRIAALRSAVSGSIVIIAQRGSRSRIETTVFEPMRSSHRPFRAQ